MLAILLISAANLACLTPRASCGCDDRPEVDATHLPYKAFAHISSEILYTPDECPDSERTQDGTCGPGIETYRGSGTFVFRSTQSTTVAYVLTARHVCEHKDSKPELGTGIDHRFIVTDYFGKQHRGHQFFTSKLFDACMMSVDDVDDDIQMASVTKDVVKQGEKVFNLAAPRSVFSSFMVLTFQGFYSGETVDGEIFTVPAGPGSSGSPVFNTRGQVVSMLWSVPVEDIEEDGKTKQKPLLENIACGLKQANVSAMVDSVKTIDELFGPFVIGPDVYGQQATPASE